MNAGRGLVEKLKSVLHDDRVEGPCNRLKLREFQWSRKTEKLMHECSRANFAFWTRELAPNMTDENIINLIRILEYGAKQ